MKNIYFFYTHNRLTGMCLQVKFICLPNSGVDNDQTGGESMSTKSKRNALNINSEAANIATTGVVDNSGTTAV